MLIDNILQTDVDDGEEPDDEYNPVQRYDDPINDEDLRCLEHVEEEVHALRRISSPRTKLLAARCE